jgi:flagellar assembly factor FliW
MTEQPDLTAILGEESQSIEFPAGLVGLEEWHKFVIISHPAGGTLRLLKSVEDPRVSFIVAAPNQIMAGYRLNLAHADADALRYAGKPGLVPEDETDLAAYCILSVQEEPFKVTANLLGPLVVNWQTGLGRQVIQSDSTYAARFPITQANNVQPASETQSKKEGV